MRAKNWIATPAKLAGRYDDCFFLDAQTGWAINSAGEIYRTDDGARSWEPQPQQVLGGLYLRCMGMLASGMGWIGCTTPGSQLYMTEDGGRQWRRVENLPKVYNSPDDADVSDAICGLHALDDGHVFASGANSPESPPRFLKSDDGGNRWKARDMSDVASALIDVLFLTPEVGFVVGGRGLRPNPQRSDLLPVVLKTEDGGQTWRDLLPRALNPPLGEWGWKIQRVNDSFLVVACENFSSGAILVSEDGGESWDRREIRNANGELVNANLEGVGFLDRQVGWVGGWGDEATASGRTSGTVDGGRTWTDLTSTWPKPLREDECPNDVDRGQYLNRFRFVDGVGYASGNTVYKYTDEDPADFIGPGETPVLLLSDAPLVYEDVARIPIEIASGTQSVRVEIYDRFAGKVRTLVDEREPSSGRHELVWDLRADDGRPIATQQFVIRAVADGLSEARTMTRAADRARRVRGEHYRLRPLMGVDA